MTSPKNRSFLHQAPSKLQNTGTESVLLNPKAVSSAAYYTVEKVTGMVTADKSLIGVCFCLFEKVLLFRIMTMIWTK